MTQAFTKTNSPLHVRPVVPFVAANRYKVCTVCNQFASHDSLLYCNEHVPEICCTSEKLSWQICMFLNFIGSTRANVAYTRNGALSGHMPRRLL